ncbi:MAG: hypothetical protein HUJ68_07600 [Clostridia bacterium]|nr:hypothetical protein [Clostridia bacterium]
MLVENYCSPKMWESTFQKKFSNFCKKSSIMLSMIIEIRDGRKGVTVVHANTNNDYFFPFDYKKNVKDFIAEIKEFLVERHYPRIIQQVYEKHENTKEELVAELEKDPSKVDALSKYSMRLTGERLFRIDKVLQWKNIALLYLEDSTFPDDKKGVYFKYKFNTSLVVYMRKYRKGEFDTLEKAGDEFFSNSSLISVLDKKEGEENNNVED